MSGAHSRWPVPDGRSAPERAAARRARRSALASLLELQRRGEAVELGGAWSPAHA